MQLGVIMAVACWFGGIAGLLIVGFSPLRGADLATPDKPPASQPHDAVWGPVHDGLRSRIWIDRPPVGPKAAISVHYEIQNVSDQEKVVWHNGFWPDHRIEVTGPGGQAAAMTRLGEQIRKIADSGVLEKRYPISVRAGASDADWPVLNLRDYFVIDTPGQYVIRYIRLQGGSELVSNSLRITIHG